MKIILMLYAFVCAVASSYSQENSICSTELPVDNYFGRGDTIYTGERTVGWYSGSETKDFNQESEWLPREIQEHSSFRLNVVLSFILEYYGIPYDSMVSNERKLSEKIRSYQLYKYHTGIILTNKIDKNYDYIVGQKTRNELAKDLDSICQSMNDEEYEVDYMKKDLDSMSQNISHEEHELDSMRKDLDSIYQRIDEVQHKIDSVKKDIHLVSNDTLTNKKVSKDSRFVFFQFVYGFGLVKIDDINHDLEYFDGAVGLRILKRLYLGGSVRYENIKLYGRDISYGALLVYNFAENKELPFPTIGYQIGFGEIIYHSILMHVEPIKNFGIVGKYTFSNPSLGIGFRITL
ncbi:hypothetical protein COB64_02500 [Candidatus Wolfebacteria bacterium]|nr:MAG: hypothetical protein COB64_02500 [Candidatus Wolfebacteria bacterium]